MRVFDGCFLKNGSQSDKPQGLPVTRILVLVLCFVASCYAPSSAPEPTVTAGPLADAATYLARVDGHAGNRDYERAIADYNEALRLHPDWAEAFSNRGYAYYWKGEAARAIADYSRAIELRSDYAYAYNNRGVAYMASGDATRAILGFDCAIQLKSDLSQAYTNRGNADLRLGQLGQALADFRQARARP